MRSYPARGYFYVQKLIPNSVSFITDEEKFEEHGLAVSGRMFPGCAGTREEPPEPPEFDLEKIEFEDSNLEGEVEDEWLYKDCYVSISQSFHSESLLKRFLEKNTVIDYTLTEKEFTNYHKEVSTYKVLVGFLKITDDNITELIDEHAEPNVEEQERDY
ncbi:hypothetical protein N9948_02055 [bacterium]|nr:hypothetical protein [bacterium]